MLTSIKSKLAAKICHVFELNKKDLQDLLEIPKNLQHGDLALPVFFLAKTLKKAPAMIASEYSNKIKTLQFKEIREVTALSGYINFKMSWEVLSGELLQSLSEPARLGYSNIGEGKTLVIDFSSPNVAKKMSVGHLRATVIGQCIYNLAKSQSYKVIGLNHLGDWGTQFGKLAWAMDNWSGEYAKDEDPMKVLTELYVRFHEEAEKLPELEKQGAAYFKRLEEGDSHVSELWKKIVEISMSNYNEMWKLLGVKHDLVLGESFYNDKLKSTEQLLEKKNILEESEGAMVVKLEGDRPPCLIRKADGASLYATRDLASAIYRREVLKADLNLYVVGQDQTLHFQQIFEVLKKMGYEWAEDCHHISFGMYRFKDMGRMSTRKGNVIHLEDVLNKAISSIKKVIEEKNPNLKDKDLVARQVGVGAVIFNDLVNDRTKNVDFDWERVLSFEGDSGPYVQYVAVRCKSILRKFNKKLPKCFSVELNSSEEHELIVRLLSFDEVLSLAFKNFKPHFLANYLLDLCRAFNQFYHKCRIIDQEQSLAESRAKLVEMTEAVLSQGLSILNIQCPDEM
ncbi:MAG: arginine--tRNA ligase [Bdellovibrionaceae bacterium]|nr:arginine--tRNA ligase [Pseudobdellovibrionaceae bacterium]